MDIELPDRLGDDVTLGEQLAKVWARKWFVLSSTVLALGIAAAAAWLVTPEYQASVLLMPVSQSSSRGGLGGGLSSLGSQFGGLAALAGLSLGGSEQKEESVAVLQSEALTDMYIQKNNLLPLLYKKRWNPRTQTWKSSDPGDIPTLWKANRYFKGKVRSVGTNTKTGMITLTITWTDPKLAAAWANGLVKMTNDYLRNKAIVEAQHDIDYLTEAAAKTNIVDIKQGIYAILLDEIKKEMLARGTEEYAFRVIDPAVVPEKPESPKKLVWILIGGCLGLLISAGVVLVQADKRR